MRRALLIFPLFLTACAGGNNIDYLRMRDIPAPTTQSFTHCYNYGCSKRATLSLPTETKSKIDNVFTTPSLSSDEEKKRIIHAIQIFEQDIGEITGTKNDKRGTFLIYEDAANTTKNFQQDCVDESTNTTTYLTLLNNMNYLKFYTPTFPANRQPFFGGGRWWHQTATMQDIATGDRYAVDSWFEDNGKASYIVPLKDWKNGWKPKKTNQRD